MFQIYKLKSYENQENEPIAKLSILDLVNLDRNSVELKIFKKVSEENKFFQIKITELNEEDEHTMMIQFIDITNNV